LRNEEARKYERIGTNWKKEGNIRRSDSFNITTLEVVKVLVLIKPIGLAALNILARITKDISGSVPRVLLCDFAVVVPRGQRLTVEDRIGYISGLTFAQLEARIVWCLYG